VDTWAEELKLHYLHQALRSLDEIAVSKSRKQPLNELAHYLIKREK
jgi:geranylgeranyl diphosphate synthase type II